MPLYYVGLYHNEWFMCFGAVSCFFDRRLRRLLLCVCLVLLSLGWSAAAFGAPGASAPVAYRLSLHGGIGPATAGWFKEALGRAERAKARLLLVELDTPGGLSSSMRDIIQRMLTSPVPVVMYVSPSGARAASAGTYLLYAASVAAMAPGTNLGAATPVAAGGSKMNDTSAKKARADASAYLRSLAQLHGRNVHWAGEAVDQSASLSASEALKKGVIDVMAPDVSTLVEKINGRRVLVADKPMILRTDGLIIKELSPNWRWRFLQVITSPSVAYILLMAGIYGIFLEVMHPGTLLPGIIGGICLLLGAYAMHLLPVSYVGLALMGLGLGLGVAEIFAPGVGILGLGGLVAFVIGSVLLFDRSEPALRVAIPVIAGVALAGAAAIIFVMRVAMRSRHAPVVSGREALIGVEGELVMRGEDYYLPIAGERWRVTSSHALAVGMRVRVLSITGLVLTVTPVEQSVRPSF